MRQPLPFFRIQTRRGCGVLVLCGALDLDIARRVRPRDQRLLRSHIDWLNDHLPAPPAEAYWCEKGVRPFTWFKSSAGEMLDRTLAIARIACEYGHRTRLIRTRHPGKIAYEDDWQIVAHGEGVVGLMMPVEREPRVDRELIRRARQR